jgi:hypothetical protein
MTPAILDEPIRSAASREKCLTVSTIQAIPSSRIVLVGLVPRRAYLTCRIMFNLSSKSEALLSDNQLGTSAAMRSAKRAPWRQSNSGSRAIRSFCVSSGSTSESATNFVETDT